MTSKCPTGTGYRVSQLSHTPKIAETQGFQVSHLLSQVGQPVGTSGTFGTAGTGGTNGTEVAFSGGPQVLRPFHRGEVLSIAEAAHLAGKSVRTIRDWCLLHDLGRRIGGQWAVSKVTLAMWLDGNKEALAAYLAGDRSSPTVTAYFERCDVPLPWQTRAADNRSENQCYRNQKARWDALPR
jgi:hypothetical protein